MAFVCHRTVRMVAVYQLKTNYDQDKFRVVFVDAKRVVNFLLEDKHVVNEHHVVRKSHDATQKKNLLTWYISLKTNMGKTFAGVAVYWEE